MYQMEDSKKSEKVQAKMKISKRANFLYNLILYSLTSIITCLFFSYPFNWFPSMKHLILFSDLPNNISYYFSDAKSLFIVANLIVLILIGESKLTRSSSSSPNIYDEYVRRNRSRLKLNVVLKEEDKDGDLIMQSMNLSEEKRRGNMKKREIRVCRSMKYDDQKEKKSGMMRMSRSEVWGESEIAKMEKTMVERECIPNKEELDIRVEAFIARVNKQRLLEAKLEHRSRC